jgi:hypothetical protein
MSREKVKYVLLVAEKQRPEKGAFMKRAKEILKDHEMKPEYDFSSMKGAVRGKYHKAYRTGHKVVIHKEDGSTSVQYFKLEEGAVMLEPDVRKYFSTSESVNGALRSLISIFPGKKRTSAHVK